MKAILFVLLSCILAQLLAACAGRSDQVEPSSQRITALVDLLEGEYDNNPQMLEDIQANLLNEMRHARTNRTFVRVDAPLFDEHVLVSSARYGGDPWYVAKTEFFAWTFNLTSDGEGVEMKSWKFKNHDDLLPHALDAKKLAGFSKSDVVVGTGGASCTIQWYPHPNGYVGRNTPCEGLYTPTQQNLSWDWEFKLSNAGIEIQVTGKDEAGRIIDQPPSGIAYQLQRQ